MRMCKFIVCPNCGYDEKFKVFTSNVQVIYQSPEAGIRSFESSILPNLRQGDNYIECQLCFEKFRA
jgi:DNA-directed RNA polymerase subunit RPC12/RpoP